jgi:hypothetical protein
MVSAATDTDTTIQDAVFYAAIVRQQHDKHRFCSNKATCSNRGTIENGVLSAVCAEAI